MSLKLNRPLQSVLFFIDLALVVIVLYEIIFFWSGPKGSFSKTVPSSQKVITSAASLPALDLILQRRQFTYIVSGRRDPFKSLLVQEKKPLPKVPEKIKKSPPKEVKPSFQLKGILWDEKEPLAVLTEGGKGKSYLVKVGDTVGNQKVAEITRDSVTLSDNDLRFVLKLREEKKK